MQQHKIDTNIWQNLGKVSILLLLVYAIYFAIWTIFYTETGNGDNVEHIHATWLVAYGKIPYKDFFQHHNPLLWYLFAPFIKFVGNNALTLLDVAHAVSLLAGGLVFFIVYKICVRFFQASFWGVILSLLILCPPHFYIYCFNYNPDTFMALFYAIGLYFLFAYFEKTRLQDLSIAFIAFFIAFLFTQKVLMILAVLGCLSLGVFYQKKTPISDILFAGLPPLFGLLLFITYLHYNDALFLYWQSNYPFNVKMQDYYGAQKINVMGHEWLAASVMLSIISMLCFFKKSNIYFKIISALFVIELFLRCFYFAISPYYMLPLMIYIACINSVMLSKLLKKNVIFYYLGLAVAVYYAYISVPSYLQARGQDRTFATYLSQHITPCDYVISAFLSNQSIISKDPHYYWSMLGHIDVLGDEMNIKQSPNLTELVLQYKPKLIYGGIYWNSYYWHRGENVLWQIIDKDVIDKYYLPTPFSDFYILKYEYQKKNCEYNKIQKEWSYAN